MTSTNAQSRRINVDHNRPAGFSLTDYIHAVNEYLLQVLNMRFLLNPPSDFLRGQNSSESFLNFLSLLIYHKHFNFTEQSVGLCVSFLLEEFQNYVIYCTCSVIDFVLSFRSFIRTFSQMFI